MPTNKLEMPVEDEQEAPSIMDLYHHAPNPATCPHCGSGEIAVLCEVVASYNIEIGKGGEQDWIRQQVDDDCGRCYGALCRDCLADLGVELDGDGLLVGLKAKGDAQAIPAAPAHVCATCNYCRMDTPEESAAMYQGRVLGYGTCYGHHGGARMKQPQTETCGQWWNPLASEDGDTEIGPVTIPDAPSIEPTEKPRVLVVVSGGVAQTVYCDAPVSVGVLDWDNLGDGDKFGGFQDSDPWESMDAETAEQLEDGAEGDFTCSECDTPCSEDRRSPDTDMCKSCWDRRPDSVDDAAASE